ncbi:uncharacterized protein DEA37_0005807 [Paragonimus westermani]|uniref:Integrase catalytic domain-containing protein n=1 Tax=Paragonimus westermani TaxID=34504 RepID=A0A5J4N6P4_9TREM|nr:uncharacterized protein DEA37_0005807 [Paragonimus westermani]
MDTMLTDIPGAAAYLDDIVVTGADEAELTERLDLVLGRIAEYGFRIRQEKCNFLMHSIKYLGFIIDRHGRRPDPNNIQAVIEMPPPSDVPTLRSFLGLVSHYSAFMPAMHRVRAPLNRLLTKDVSWNWSTECQNSFEEVKKMLNSDNLLTHFDPTLQIVVASDASSYGVGAVLSHLYPDGSQKAVAHAARSLSSAEKNYGQTEKEALAIVFAVKRFHKMLFGRHFILLTDHKPLLAVFGSKKGIPIYTANRLQRWATTLLNYDFDIRYTSTTSIGQADALSRLIGSQTPDPEEALIAAVSFEAEVNQVFSEAIRTLPVTAEPVAEATLRDQTLQSVISYNQNRWPDTGLTGDLAQFFRRRSAISNLNGCVLFGERVVIPRELQPRVIRQLHVGHPGICRMKALARSYVYWPGMDEQLEQLVRSYHGCAYTSKAPPKAPLESWPIPTAPWSRVHLDFAGPLHGQNFLIAVDAYSKWPEVLMPSTTTGSTVLQLRKMFSRFGCPTSLVSDNGTQFTSSVFDDFCLTNDTA